MARAPRGMTKPAEDTPSSARPAFERRSGALPDEVTRLHEHTAEHLLAEAPAWAQQARVDPYNGQVTHYIDIAGNATAPEAPVKGSFSVPGQPSGIPDAYLPPGARDPKPKAKPGAGPPTVADDLINQVDLARMRIVKDLKHETSGEKVASDAEPKRSGLIQKVQKGLQARRSVPANESAPETPAAPSQAQQALGKWQEGRGEFRVSTPAPLKTQSGAKTAQPTDREKAQETLQAKLDSRGLGEDAVQTSDPSLDR